MNQYRIQISHRDPHDDPRGGGTAAQIRDFLQLPVDCVATTYVYTVFLDAQQAEAQTIAEQISNPVIQEWTLGHKAPDIPFHWAVIVGYRPGVTDNVARSAASAIGDILGRPLRADEEVYTSTEYFLQGSELDRAAAERIAEELLANSLIQTVTVLSDEEWHRNGPPLNRPHAGEETPVDIRTFELTTLDDDALLALSRSHTLALTLAEMKAIQGYFAQRGKQRRAVGLAENPTDMELEVLAQTWSEHCKHKIFNARIRYTDEHGHTELIDSCFKTFIRKSTQEIAEHVDWLLSVFHDNAGVIAFNDELSLVYKVETHNSPTALDPYGGSMTGIVGVNRDPLGTGRGADLLFNVWGYCFGSPFTDPDQVPQGLFHPRRLRDQVHKGVTDGGNQSGIPYMVGWEYFDPRYLGKPLVYCGTLGTLPRILNGKPGEDKAILPGDRAVMVGGRIGKDGIHGATFSSEELHGESPVQAVQIGDPITQKMMADFLHEARDRGLYRFITDNGAGGLSSSLGEMAEIAGGCRLELAHAPLKYSGLQPWEIIVSEAQERMSLAVPPDKLDEFLALAKQRDVEATDLGCFDTSGLFHVTYKEQTVCHLELEFMHEGLPQLELTAKWVPPAPPCPALPERPDLHHTLCRLLGSLNICSGEHKARQYDHEVKGLSVIKPYVGIEADVLSDATVSTLEPAATEGIILAAGVAPRYSDIDTYPMMASVIDLAVRRTIAVGGSLDCIAGLDNFCWPDPVVSEANPDGEYKCAQLVRANKALYDYCKAFGVPCISGKDSMKNDSTMGGRRISIPPTVLFSTVAPFRDVTKAVTLDVKKPGDIVYVLGITRDELGGSEYHALHGGIGPNAPSVDAESAIRLYHAVSRATDRRLCRSLHTPALGGLAVAFAKSAIGGRLGLHIDLDHVPNAGGLDTPTLLFSESNSRFVATVAPENAGAFEQCLGGLPFAHVGHVTGEPTLRLQHAGEQCLNAPLDELVAAYKNTLKNV